MEGFLVAFALIGAAQLAIMATLQRGINRDSDPRL